MQLIMYFLLVALYVPLLTVLIKKNYLYNCPFYSVYLFSIFIFNIIGSIVVFEHSMSIFSTVLYSDTFFYILMLQLLVFYATFPLLKVFSRTANQRNLVTYGFSTLAFRMYLACWAGALVIIALFVMLYGLPPLMKVGYGGGNSVIIAARNDFFDTVGQFWFFRIGFYLLPMVAGVVAYVWYRTTGEKKAKLCFVYGSILGSFLALQFLHKTPLAMYWIGIFFAKIMFERQVKIKVLMVSLVGLITTLGVLYYIYYPGQDLEYYVSFLSKSLLNRIFGAYAMTLAHVPIITEDTGYFYGATFNNPMGLLPHEVVNISKMVHEMMFHIEGYAPPPAMGYAYADFGLIGVVFWSLFLCLFLLFLQALVNSFKSYSARLAAIAYLCSKVMFLSMQSISDIVVNPVEIITVCLVIILLNLPRFRVLK